MTIKTPLEWEAIRALFRRAGFEVEDRCHHCYAFVKAVKGQEDAFWLIGKHLEEGGSDLPTSMTDPVYAELQVDGCVDDTTSWVFPSFQAFLSLIDAFKGESEEKP